MFVFAAAQYLTFIADDSRAESRLVQGSRRVKIIPYDERHIKRELHIPEYPIVIIIPSLDLLPELRLYSILMRQLLPEVCSFSPILGSIL